MCLADGVGFEPTVPCGTPHFKCGAISLSATHPKHTFNHPKTRGFLSVTHNGCAVILLHSQNAKLFRAGVGFSTAIRQTSPGNYLSGASRYLVEHFCPINGGLTGNRTLTFCVQSRYAPIIIISP